MWMKLPKPPWPSAGLVRETKRRLARRKPNLLKKNKYYFCPPMSLSSTCGGALCMCWSPQDLGFPNVCPGATFAGLWWAPECGSPKTHPPQQRSSALPHFHTYTLPHSHTSTLPQTKTLHGIQGLSRRSIDDHTIWNQYRFWG